MREITRKVYETDDGKIFDTKDAAEKHEAKRAERMKRTTYWVVRHNPDLTEGRSMQSCTVVECFGPEYLADLYMNDWCFRTFGRPIAFVQGVAPTPAWHLRKDDGPAFLHPRSTDKVVHLVLGERETGLIDAKPEA